MDIENYRDYIAQTYFGNTDWPHGTFYIGDIRRMSTLRVLPMVMTVGGDGCYLIPITVLEYFLNRKIGMEEA